MDDFALNTTTVANSTTGLKIKDEITIQVDGGKSEKNIRRFDF